MELASAPPRIIKFRMPAKDDNLNFYSSSDYFLEIYKDMKKRKAINTLIIKKDIDSKTYEEILDIIDPSTHQEEIL
jgi:hypothetical protein